jgi:hypothetical protein
MVYSMYTGKGWFYYYLLATWLQVVIKQVIKNKLSQPPRLARELEP